MEPSTPPLSAPAERPDTGEGVQSVKRALDIVRILSFHNASTGMRFSDLQTQSGLSKGTLHRLLKTLTQEGFVEQAAGTRTYYLGLEFLSMGERAANRLDIRAVVRPTLERLGSATGNTIMLTIRSGLDAVCIDREEGSFPVRALTQNIGTRRPLGIGSGSLALLAALADDEVESVIARNAGRLSAYPSANAPRIRAWVDETRKRGYAFNEGHVLKGMYGVGVVIKLGESPVAALSMAAHYGRMDAEHRIEIGKLLQREARRLSVELGSR